MTSGPRRAVRCANYKEGLEMSFNSLDAQREASQSFIASQRQEGWTALPALYDDGGYSGGSMERPALKRLSNDKVRISTSRSATGKAFPDVPLLVPCGGVTPTP